MELDELKELKIKEMEVCMNILYKYGFHDAFFSSLSVENMQAVFEFEEGVYSLDEYARETELTGKCRLVLEFYDDPLLSFEIFRARYGRVKEIECKELQKRLLKGKFRIDQWSYSSFESGIIFKGYIGYDRYELIMHNVIKATVETTISAG